jgi:N-acetylneuraminate synthase
MRLIEVAAAAGASAVKFQTYLPETMTLPLDSLRVSTNHELWGGKNLFELYQSAMTPWEWHADFFRHAKSQGLTPFSSPFDRSAVDFLEDLDCEIYKIASLETGDLDLIRYVADTGKPIIISTGASEFTEIEEALTAALSAKSSEVTLLVCTSSYPARPADSHLRRIQTLEKAFGVRVGLSDHTLGIGVALAAIGLGASVIEKHLTISREDGGLDSAFSMEPHEFRMMVHEGKNGAQALGSGIWEIQPSETESRRLRRSLYVTKDVRAGEVATRHNIKALRPNSGAPIRNLDRILGRTFLQDAKAGSPANIDLFFEDIQETKGIPK